MDMLAGDFSLLEARMGERGFAPRFVLLAVALGIIYASLTSIIYWTPSPGINPSIEWVRVAPIAIVVLLTSLLLTIQWPDIGRAKPARKGHHAKMGLFGSVVAFFASGCAVCQPIWLVWLGLGQASLFLIDLSVWISLLSILLLLFALHAKLNERCELNGGG